MFCRRLLREKAAEKRRAGLAQDAKRSRASRLRWNTAILLVVVYNMVGAADIVSTSIALESGAGYEANPLIRALMDETGDGWITAKLALQGVITVMVLYFPHWIVLAFFAVASSWNALIVYNNFVIAGLFS